MSTAVLEDLRAGGFVPRLHWPEPEDPTRPARTTPRLIVDSDEPLPEDQRSAIRSHRDELKASLLLSDPPAWLRRLFDLYWSGHDTPVSLTSPATGKAEVYMVHVSIKNICAAVAAEIGVPIREWEKVGPEVEEALGAWEGTS